MPTPSALTTRMRYPPTPPTIVVDKRGQDPAFDEPLQYGVGPGLGGARRVTQGADERPAHPDRRPDDADAKKGVDPNVDEMVRVGDPLEGRTFSSSRRASLSNEPREQRERQAQTRTPRAPGSASLQATSRSGEDGRHEVQDTARRQA